MLREEEEGAPELCVRVGNPLLPFTVQYITFCATIGLPYIRVLTTHRLIYREGCERGNEALHLASLAGLRIED